MSTHALSVLRSENRHLKRRVTKLENLLQEAHNELQNYLHDCGSYESPENVPDLARTIARIAKALETEADNG